MAAEKFDVARAARLSDPARLEILVPEVMWRAADVDDPRVIVDVGAGAGLLTFAFARLAPRATVFAADVSEEMLAFLAAHVPPDLADRIVPVLADESHVPLPDGTAGLVTMVALFHELHDPAATLTDARRLLVAGGRLLVVDWAKEEAPNGPSFASRAAAADIVAAAVAAGFSSVETHEVLRGFSVLTGTRDT